MKYEFISSLGTKIIVYSKNTLKDTYSYANINEFLKQIKNNLGDLKYIGNELFSLTIELYHEESPLIPEYLKRNCGLYYSGSNLLQINNQQKDFSFKNKDDYMSNILSHEFGHHFANHVGFNMGDTNSSITKFYWNNIRGKDATSETNIGELFAEDFRYLFGSNNAKGYLRGTFRKVTEIPCLKNFLLMYKLSNDYFRNCKNIIESFNFEIDNNLCHFYFYEKNPNEWLGILNSSFKGHWTFIRNDGIWFSYGSGFIKKV